MVELSWSVEFKILGTIKRCENTFIWSYFFESKKWMVSIFDIIKALIKIIWCLKSKILLTSRTQPSGSDSTGYWIDLKSHALTYFEPYFTKIQERTWFDHPRLQTNGFLIIDFFIGPINARFHKNSISKKSNFEKVILFSPNHRTVSICLFTMYLPVWFPSFPVNYLNHQWESYWYSKDLWYVQ